MRIALVTATIAALAIAAHADAPTAENLYNAGQTAYDAGDFTTAVAQWEESYARSKEPALLFNIAQAKRLSGDCPGAIATYKRFITADPTANQKPLAEDLARELEAKCGAKPIPIAEPPKPLKPTKPPKPTQTPYSVDRLMLVDGDRGRPKPGRSLKIAGIATSSTGVAIIAVGIGLGIHAQSVGDSVTSACRTSCDWTAWKDKDAAGRRDATIGHILDVAGAGAIASGAVLYYLGIRQESVSLSPATREGGLAISWSGSW